MDIQIPASNKSRAKGNSGPNAAAVGFYLSEERSDALRIVANAKGIDALLEELKAAQQVIAEGHAHLPGDPDWMTSDVKLVAIEPDKYFISPESRELRLPVKGKSRILIVLLFAFLCFLIVLGAVTLFRFLI